MKLLWVLPCLAVCACVARKGTDTYYEGTNSGQQLSQAQYAVATESQKPYALKPAIYENDNFALNQKESELFQKEKNLLDAQQELYDREKKLANREAEFINRSKALDYKEKNIEGGRLYAPVAMPAGGRPHPAPQVQVQPAPVPAPMVENTFAPYALQEDEVSFQNTTVYTTTSVEPAQPEFVIMQHPIQRDLVRCPASDDVCLQSYERLGYVRAANLSRFTAQDELNNAGTYPANTSGKWRENNSIPRW